MTNIHTLKKQAQKATAWRGHRMRWIPAISHGERRELQTGVCTRCDATVHLNTRPLPNEIDIGGEAVALNCTRRA
jgi:hypothetical protein